MATFTNKVKYPAKLQGKNKQGSGWSYEESDILYEMDNLYYNTFDLPTAFVNKIKTSIIPTNKVKT